MRSAITGVLCFAILNSATAQDAPLRVPLPPPRVQQAILQAVQQIAPASPLRRRYRLALAYGMPLFPSDEDLQRPPQEAGVRAWLALPEDQRRHDVLIIPDTDYYWPAEDRWYSCQFLIHLSAPDTSSTQLSIVQLAPTLYQGKAFHLLGRTGPGYYLDLHPTTPSTSSAAALQEFLRAALDAPR